MERIKEILPRALKKQGLISGIQERVIILRWKDFVGETIAVHTQPQRLSKGRLIVNVDSPAWLHQLIFLQSDILKVLQKNWGEGIIKEIHFYHGNKTAVLRGGRNRR
jgi:predicted nucleic acid-binding Zn ribbon protein